MAQALMGRPLGMKQGLDFDTIELRLLRPALEAAGVSSVAIGVITASGDIREDVLRRLFHRPTLST